MLAIKQLLSTLCETEECLIYMCEMCINMHMLYNLIMSEDTNNEFLYGFKPLITVIINNMLAWL